jgi:hypothetical protein
MGRAIPLSYGAFQVKLAVQQPAGLTLREQGKITDMRTLSLTGHVADAINRVDSLSIE